MKKVYNINFYTGYGVYTSRDCKSKDEALNLVKDKEQSELVKQCNKLELIYTEVEDISNLITENRL